MTNLILFAAILFSSFAISSGQIVTGTVPDGDVHKCRKSTVLDSLNVSIEGDVAVHALIKAERFDTGYVGFAGTASASIVDLNTVLKERDAAELFKYIFENGSTAGKLYALNGLYLTDRDEFQRSADVMKKSGQTVRVLNGCLMSDKEVSKIIETDAKNAVIIKPGKTVKEFWATHSGGGFELDIAHGGYPATFREMANFKKGPGLHG